MSDVVRRYREAVAAFDFEALGKLRHPDYQCYYPQSGERFLSHEQWVAAHRDYTSRFQRDDLASATVKGGRRKARVARQTSPMGAFSAPVVLASGAGDLAVMEGKGTWPDGKTYHWARIIELRDGLVWRETEYFAEPFEAPAWRAEFVVCDERD